MIDDILSALFYTLLAALVVIGVLQVM